MVRIGRLLWIFGYGSKFGLQLGVIPNFSTGKAFSRSKTPIEKVSRDFDRAREFFEKFQKFSKKNFRNKIEKVTRPGDSCACHGRPTTRFTILQPDPEILRAFSIFFERALKISMRA